MKRVAIFALFLIIASGALFAEATFQLDVTITHMSSTPEGLLIMINKPVPDNCIGTAYGWLLIPQNDTAMISAAFFAFEREKTISIYTSGIGRSGFGEINQLDLGGPHNK
jgi:hypothetical protein